MFFLISLPTSITAHLISSHPILSYPILSYPIPHFPQCSFPFNLLYFKTAVMQRRCRKHKILDSLEISTPYVSILLDNYFCLSPFLILIRSSSYPHIAHRQIAVISRSRRSTNRSAETSLASPTVCTCHPYDKYLAFTSSVKERPVSPSIVIKLSS